MKNQKKLIVIVTMIALLICAALMTCALADEKIYTSPTFKLPADEIMEWVETQPEGEAPEGEQPAEGTPEEGEAPEGEQPAEGTPEEGEPEEGDDFDEDRDDEPAGDTSEQGETPAEGTPEEGEPEEGEDLDEDRDDEPAGDTSEQGETPAEGTGEEDEIVGVAKTPERSVMIRSSQGDVVTEGEIIYLTSKLKGFDGLDIAYQWQVDRGDGAGWVDVEGANRSKHMFVADRETITYSWRLIVTILNEE